MNFWSRNGILLPKLFRSNGRKNCSSDLKNFANSSSNFKSFSQSLERFFLTVSPINLGNKIPFFLSLPSLPSLYVSFISHTLWALSAKKKKRLYRPIRARVWDTTPLRENLENKAHIPRQEAVNNFKFCIVMSKTVVNVSRVSPKLLQT